VPHEILINAPKLIRLRNLLQLPACLPETVKGQGEYSMITSVIWGAGNIGKGILFSLPSSVEILFFVDSNPAKIGTSIQGKPVLSPVELANHQFDELYIANTHGKVITSQLHTMFPRRQFKIIDTLNEGLLDHRIAMLRHLAEAIQNATVPGMIAEAGVFRGDFSYYMNRAFPERQFYLFDTFEGFSKTDLGIDANLDLSSPPEGLFANTSIDTVRSKLATPEQCTFFPGYFPDTTSSLHNDTYCFVSIDFDLYKPIKDAITYFYERLNHGGYIMVHDYHNPDFLGVHKAVSELQESLGLVFFPIPDGGGSIVIGK